MPTKTKDKRKTCIRCRRGLVRAQNEPCGRVRRDANGETWKVSKDKEGKKAWITHHEMYKYDDNCCCVM